MATEFIKTLDINYRVELVELHTKLDQTDKNSKNFLHVYLQANPNEFEEEIGLIRVSMRKLRLSVKADGFFIDPSSKYNPKIISTNISFKQDEEIVTSGSIEAGAEMSAKAEFSLDKGPLAFTHEAKGNAKASTSGSQTVKRTLVAEHYPVRSLTGNVWDISMPNEAPLEGTFLQNVQICTLEPKEGANRRAVETLVEARQRDIDISLDEASGFLDKIRESRQIKSLKLNNNKEKLIKIAFSKSISGEGNDYKGIIAVSRSVISDE